MTGLEILERNSQEVSLEVDSPQSRIGIRICQQPQSISNKGSDHHHLLHGYMKGIMSERGIPLGVMKGEIGSSLVVT